MRLRPHLITTGGVSARDVAAWRDLATRAVEPNPFAEPDYVLPLTRNHGGPMTLLTVGTRDQMVVCLPLYKRFLYQSRVPVPVWAVPGVLGVPLVDEAHAAEGLAMAVEFLARRASIRRLLLMPRVPADGGPIAGLVCAAVAGRTSPGDEPAPVQCPRLRRRPSPTYLDETLTGKRRYNVRRQRLHLERELGEPLRIVDRSDDPRSVDRFLALEAGGWKGRKGTAMLSNAPYAAWFREMCAGFRAARRLCVLSYEAAGTTVAMKCDVVAGGGLFNLKTSYDERFARFSPGVLLEIEAVTRFHESGYSFMDSCTNHPTNPACWLYPDSRPLVDVVVALGGGLSRSALAGMAGIAGLAAASGRRRLAAAGAGRA